MPDTDPRTVICRICKTEQPVSQRGLIKRHKSDDPDFYCDGSLKPEEWGLPATDPLPGLEVSINDERGYPCPKDGTILTLIPGEWPTAGAWCPKCHTVWRELDEVSLKDLDDA